MNRAKSSLIVLNQGSPRAWHSSLRQIRPRAGKQVRTGEAGGQSPLVCPGAAGASPEEMAGLCQYLLKRPSKPPIRTWSICPRLKI
jgi:hypothetical protein